MTRRRAWALAALLLVLIAAGFAANWFRVAYPIYRQNINTRIALPNLPPPRQTDRIVIFAPHEDDETLGAGGYIQQAVAAGADVRLVMMTNGEYPEIDVFLFQETLRMTPAAFVALGYMRQKETISAMRYLGVGSDRITFLGYPNQFLDQMWQAEHWLPNNPVRSIRTQATSSPYNNSMTPHAIYCGESMLNDVETVLSRYKPNIVMTIHPSDIHVDHWPTGAAVRFALRELAAKGDTFAEKCAVYTYLIHRDFWPAPRGYRPLLPLVPPRSLVGIPTTDWRSLPMELGETSRKRRAIGLYYTQGGRYDRLLLSFARSTELFGLIPELHWSKDGSASIPDPTGDLVSVIQHPEADISNLSLSRHGNSLSIRVITRKPASAHTTYHFSIHTGGANSTDRVIADYAWRGASTSGKIVAEGKLGSVPSSQLRAKVDGYSAELTIPWPAPGSAAFVMVRAWTSAGEMPVDETGETVIGV